MPDAWFDQPVPPDMNAIEEESLSDQRRRTLRQSRRLQNGRHPIMDTPLARNGETCGSCAHFERHEQARVWFKCALIGGGSEATDIRKGWPACKVWRAP